MLNLLKPTIATSATSGTPVLHHPGERSSNQPSVNLETGGDPPSLPVLARIVEEAEQATAEKKNSRVSAASVAERMQRLYAFD
jgi:hypothetical protein